jgi:hypothetical protein
LPGGLACAIAVEPRPRLPRSIGEPAWPQLDIVWPRKQIVETPCAPGFDWLGGQSGHTA